MNLSVQPNSFLTLHYRIALASGPGKDSVLVDTFKGSPATLQMGNGQWAPGLEQALIGKVQGSSFSVLLNPLQAYGERYPDLIQRVSRTFLEEYVGQQALFEPGNLIEFTASNGRHYSGILKTLNNQWALLDFNHPLAGLSLNMDVDILGVL